MIDSQGGRQENQGTIPEAVAEHPAWHRLEGTKRDTHFVLSSYFFRERTS